MVKPTLYLPCTAWINDQTFFFCANVLMKMFDSRSNVESHFNAMLKAAAKRIMFIVMLFEQDVGRTCMHDG